MKEIIYSDHAERRRKQRGITSFEIELVLTIYRSKRKRPDGKIEIVGLAGAREIKIIYLEEEKYLKIISVM